jgi:hypothetical protein
MVIAVCISGTDDNHKSESFRHNLTKNLSDVVFFHSDDNSFDSSIFKLTNQKQRYELDCKQEFKLVIYIARDFFTTDVNIKNPKICTLYTINKYIDDYPEVFFHNLTQYHINTDFFYCDSKTFNIVSNFYKFKNMIKGEFPIPEKSKFYSFLLNMGVKVDDI